MNKINYVLNTVKNKDEVKATTTFKFKQDLIDVLFNRKFEGDILEIGTSAGYTTALLCAIAEKLEKHVYSFEYNWDSVLKARALCNNFGFLNFDIIHKDVYKSDWDFEINTIGERENIGCVFIDCVHTSKCFSFDLENAKHITNNVENPIIIAHDYGLVTKEGDGIKSVIDENPKCQIIRYLGEQDVWNKLGSGKVIYWEGVQLKVV